MGLSPFRRYSRASDLNISKDQRKGHRPYYKYYLVLDEATVFDNVFLYCYIC